MKTLNSIIGSMAMLSLAACSNDEPVANIPEPTDKLTEIECFTESRQPAQTRTYFEEDDKGNYLFAKWAEDDQIAMCFDESETSRRFKLLRGENSANATFQGPVPDHYSDMTAVYPFDIYQSRTSSAINIKFPSTIKYDSDRMLSGAMPMFAHGTGNVLNFYNLMGVIKLTVLGKGLLKSVTISSPDGQGLSGKGHIVLDDNGMPSLSIDDTATDLTIDFGAMFLSAKPLDILIPIPASDYSNGLKLDFTFEGKIETRELAGPLHFDRSVLRAVKLYRIEVPFEFDSYETKDNEIWYKSSSQQELANEHDLRIASHSFSITEELGVITTESPIVKIGGPIFTSPEKVTFVKLPQTVEEIAMNGMKGTAIESFEAPKNLKILGVDAFMGCAKLKRIVLNDGLKSMGAEVFGDCPNLEYVYIPESVAVIGAYSFRASTSHLDQWHGDCRLIDSDRHSLYANSSYGMVSENPDMIDIIAGCNLTEYEIPHQAKATQNYALSGCVNLKKLIIHENFKSFGTAFFCSLPQLETIICHATTPPSFARDENFRTQTLKQIFVPKACVDTYKKAKGWKNFADKIVAL